MLDLKGYASIDEHPDFANLKQVYHERSQQIHLDKMRISKRSTFKSTSNEKLPNQPWFRARSIKNQTPPIDEEIDEDHYKDFQRLGAKEVDYQWIISCKQLKILF